MLAADFLCLSHLKHTRHYQHFNVLIKIIFREVGVRGFIWHIFCFLSIEERAFFFCSFEFWNNFIFMSKFHSGSWFIFFWKARLLKLACKTILYLHAFPPATILCLTTVSIYMSFEIFITLYIYANSFMKTQKTVIA